MVSAGEISQKSALCFGLYRKSSRKLTFEVFPQCRPVPLAMGCQYWEQVCQPHHPRYTYIYIYMYTAQQQGWVLRACVCVYIYMYTAQQRGWVLRACMCVYIYMYTAQQRGWVLRVCVCVCVCECVNKCVCVYMCV